MIKAWDLLSLIAATIVFSWRMDNWSASRTMPDGAVAIFWGIVMLAIAYNIWRKSRAGGQP